ncbi:MAG: hypothetical protein J7K15_10365 [Deltaproteobacteria bacterium]|nr:hypothetical protein [Deltaproteobacteria bacterium]
MARKIVIVGSSCLHVEPSTPRAVEHFTDEIAFYCELTFGHCFETPIEVSTVLEHPSKVKVWIKNKKFVGDARWDRKNVIIHLEEVRK